MTGQYYVGPKEATEAKQDTGNSALASIDGKLPALSGGSVPVTGTIAVTDGGGSLTVDGTVGVSGSVAVTGAFWQATQPVSLASVPAHDVTNAGTFAVQAAQSGTWTVAATQSGAWNITNISGTVSLPTGAATETTLAALESKVGTTNTRIGNTNEAAPSSDTATSGLNGRLQRVAQNLTTINTALGTPFQAGGSIGNTAFGVNNGSGASAVNIQDGGNSITVDGAVTATLSAETTKVIGTVNPPALTIGTNSANGFTVQPARDAGRTPVRFYATAAAAGTTTTETAITLTRSSGNSATTTGTSFVLTSGKRLRIQSITFATRGHNTATAQTTTFNFRVNTAGAVTTSSTPIELAVRSATPATANAWDRNTIQIPDGWELLGDGTTQFGITAAATYTTNAPTWDVTIIGYEY